MFIVGMIFVFYCFLKLFFYGLYEFKEASNKTGGIAICILSILATIFTETVILIFYII